MTNSEFRILSPVLQAGLPPEGTGVSEALASLRASPVRANSEFDRVWLPPPTELILSRSEVHVWRTVLEQPTELLQQLGQTLSSDEQARAERFYFERDRQWFIVCRGLLRKILASYLGITANQVQFCYGVRGKPALADTLSGNGLKFNLSHTQGLALYAVTRDREVGIDIEYLRPIPELEQIAASFFSKGEHATLSNLPPEQKQVGFFNCWTRKEAYIKAMGDGLAIPLNQFAVSLAPGEPAQLLSIGSDRALAAKWSLQELTPAPGYVAAIAVEGHDWNLKCWNYEC